MLDIKVIFSGQTEISFRLSGNLVLAQDKFGDADCFHRRPTFVVKNMLAACIAQLKADPDVYVYVVPLDQQMPDNYFYALCDHNGAAFKPREPANIGKTASCLLTIYTRWLALLEARAVNPNAYWLGDQSRFVPEENLPPHLRGLSEHCYILREAELAELAELEELEN